MSLAVTQHNAALVEQSAAAASSLANRAQQLSELPAAFKVAGAAGAAACRPTPTTRPVQFDLH